MKINALGLTAALMLAVSAPLFAQTTPPPATSPTGQSMWYSHQPDDSRASKLIGTKVVNSANETIGDINEIVISKDGKVAAVIVGVGGFLGMGEREVAVSFESLRMNTDSSGNLILAVNATKDTLKSAPEWRWDTRKN
jgi:sporulation protein YlmC with PRC-barrel domain